MTRLPKIKEIIAFIIHHDEGWKIFNFDFPDGFHAKLWGRRDSVVIIVPPEFVEGLLAKMENRAPQASPITVQLAQPEKPAAVPAAPAPRRR